MRRYKVRIKCDRCGGECVLRIESLADTWRSDSHVQHKDRKVCDRVLRKAESEQVTKDKVPA